MYSFCNLNNVVGDILRSNRKKERHAPVQGLREEFECLIHSEMLAAQCNEKKKNLKTAIRQIQQCPLLLPDPEQVINLPMPQFPCL